MINPITSRVHLEYEETIAILPTSADPLTLTNLLRHHCMFTKLRYIYVGIIIHVWMKSYNLPPVVLVYPWYE